MQILQGEHKACSKGGSIVEERKSRMNLQQFIGKYEGVGIVTRQEEARVVLDEFRQGLEGKEVIIYGAGILGKSVANILDYLNIEVSFVLDRKHEIQSKEFHVPVYAPEYMLEYHDIANAEVLLAVNQQIAEEVIRQYRDWDCLIDFTYLPEKIQNVLKSSICTRKLLAGGFDPLSCFECGIVDNGCEVFYQYGKKCIGKEEVPETSKIEGLGVIMGQVCTLNCKHCNESLPYFKRQGTGFEKKEDILSGLELLTRACGVIGHIELVGGEPFLHPELADILKGILKLDIGVVQIFTNGTVVPGDEVCEVLANKRIVVYISNYERVLHDTFKQNRDRMQEKFVQYGVIHELGRSKSWMDFASFDEIDETDEEWRNQYENCGMNKCHRLYKGHLFGCPHHYGGTVRGFIDIKDSVDIHRYSATELAEVLRHFREEPCMACKRCKLPFHAPFVEDAIQLGDRE